MLAAAHAGPCTGPQNKIGHSAPRHRRLMQVPVLSARGIEIGSKACVVGHHNSLSDINLWSTECSCFFRRVKKKKKCVTLISM